MNSRTVSAYINRLRGDIQPILAAAIKKAGSKTKLSHALGIRFQTITRWERGESQIDAENILRLSEYIEDNW